VTSFRPLTFAIGALVATTTLVGTAEAGRFRGGFHASGHASVHWNGGGGIHVTSGIRYSRPAWQPRRWGVSGHIYVGPTYSYRPYYYGYYDYGYVPSYYGSSYYPVAPQAEAGPSTVAVLPVEAARPELPKFGLGLFAGGASVNNDAGVSGAQSNDVGILARYRLTEGLLIEGEIGKTSYEQNLRVDKRLGASLVYEFGAYNRLAPFVLAGLGVQEADTNGGDFNAKQNFAEVGGGLRYAITPHFHLTADIRVGARDTTSSDMTVGTIARTVAPPSADAADTTENYTRGRLAAILYF
jgi:hypothetical protein